MATAPRTVLITGGSRGIGLSIALKLAQAERANVCIAAKTAEPHPKLPGTIYTAAEAIERAGGSALPLVVDVRNEDNVRSAIEQVKKRFGGLDVVVNNASAIALTDSQKTSTKSFDLMHSINARGTWLTSKLAIPELVRSRRAGRNAHILTLSPPLRDNLTPEMMGSCSAYAHAKLGMSVVALALAGELRKSGVASNALWPLTYVDTEAIRLIAGQETRSRSRRPAFVASAAYEMLKQDSQSYTGNLEIDEIFLRRHAGWTSEQVAAFSSCKPEELVEDLFIPQWVRDEVQTLRETR